MQVTAKASLVICVSSGISSTYSFMTHAKLIVVLITACAISANGQEVSTDRVTVEANRMPRAEAAAPFSVTEFNAEDLAAAPELRLDDLLRAQVPGFSLFRRNSSRTANPTTQGVTLRNFGPSGAGRTLVLLDGIPLNDPFAGYVLWSEVPTADIDSVVVQPGGGAGLFGNAALAGTIFLTSKKRDETSALAEATVGNEETYELSIDGGVAQKSAAIGVFADRFSTAGYPVIATGQRGPVDTNASAESDVVGVRGEWQIGRDTSLQLNGRWFDDSRVNGTRYTRNDSRGEDFSVALRQRFAEQTAELQLALYGQHRKFSSTFSSINETRTIETPALNQFNVPADALGGSAVYSIAVAQHRLTFGGDFRAIDGETDELFSWDGSAFTKLRKAGGDQRFAGAFAEDVWSLAENATIVGGFRFDHWELSDGFRRETQRTAGTILLDQEYPDRSGDEINGRIGARVEATKQVAFRGAFYTGFRVPTLNELYRPFRVGNDITVANAALAPEHLSGGEAAIEWQPISALRFTATGFYNQMTDAIGNITIGVGPGTFPQFGFVPAGGVLRERENIDVVDAPGCETTGEWEITPTLRARASWLFTHPTIARAADRTLEGKLLAQTPENVFVSGVDWQPVSRCTLTVQLRYTDRQFDDDQNTRALAPYTTVDAAVGYEFSRNASAQLRAENLLNQQIETGKSATGVVSVGSPRLVTLQFRYRL